MRGSQSSKSRAKISAGLVGNKNALGSKRSEKTRALMRAYHRTIGPGGRVWLIGNKHALGPHKHVQSGKCALCHKVSLLYGDHDHVTGRKRDRLCINCNVGLGQFGEDPERLRAAALYLEKWRDGS